MSTTPTHHLPLLHMGLHQHPMQGHQKLFTPQRLLILWHCFRKGIVSEGTGGRDEGGPFEFGEKTVDEAEVGFRRADFDGCVLEDEGVIVFGAVF